MNTVPCANLSVKDTMTKSGALLDAPHILADRALNNHFHQNLQRAYEKPLPTPKSVGTFGLLKSLRSLRENILATSKTEIGSEGAWILGFFIGIILGHFLTIVALLTPIGQ